MRCALVIALVLASTPAHADDGAWYGHYVLGADAVGWAATIGGAKLDTPALFAGGLATLLVGPPLVHLLHGNSANAGTSLGLRFSGPVIGGLLGHLVSPRRWSGLASGVLVGYVVGAVVDIAVVARDDAEPEPVTRVFSIGGTF